MINNYFKTSHNETFNELGNPNKIRAYIDAAARADARKEHYYLGFDKSTFKSGMDQTYDFQKTPSASQHVNNMSFTPSRQNKNFSSVRPMTTGAQSNRNY